MSGRWWLAMLLVLACGPRRQAPPADPEPVASAPTSAPLSPDPAPKRRASNRRIGEPLEATIPLLDGSSMALAELQGGAVLLELSASWAEPWEQAHELYHSLIQRHGRELAVVTVAMDRRRAQLQRYWEIDPLPFVLGWDPQGALAARLQVAELPTLFLLDRDGEIVAIWGGFTLEQRTAVRQAVESVLDSPD